ncbi:hypothetical protein HC031_09505 [Planosporangium thailandense]|uniref:Uncharacterized protein n=1 Tax=Planosporangium thailandense TaxID=765197 RepID=A0ABX0XVW2_9ACTN|nr:hypothetical protein [Planosporangium thailandense]NJC69948.1 hypothetical protein [Planosporangium thailandense]
MTAIVKPGADLDSVLDQAVRLVWTSKLNPLESIVVDVTDEQDPKRFASKRLSPKKAEDKTELECKYGPRPK